MRIEFTFVDKSFGKYREIHSIYRVLYTERIDNTDPQNFLEKIQIFFMLLNFELHYKDHMFTCLISRVLNEKYVIMKLDQLNFWKVQKISLKYMQTFGNLFP